jgi:hypothetical protein
MDVTHINKRSLGSSVIRLLKELETKNFRSTDWNYVRSMSGVCDNSK